MQNTKKINHKKSSKPAIITGAVVLVAAVILFAALQAGNRKQEASTGTGEVKVQSSKDGDLKIAVADVTDKASFYGYEMDGQTIEVLAVKASDGSIRTAFNTCQVCYSSGRGYYEQEGDYLVCQNCGNRFGANEVETSKGGCNPVPIFSENKTEDNASITISREFLEQAKDIFENWKE